MSQRGEGGKFGVGLASLCQSPCTPWIAHNWNSPATERRLFCSWGGVCASTSEREMRRRAHNHFAWSDAVLNCFTMPAIWSRMLTMPCTWQGAFGPVPRGVSRKSHTM